MSLSWESSSCSATCEIPNFLRNYKAHCCVHKSPPLVSTLSQTNPVYNLTSYFCVIHFNIKFPSMSRFFSGIFTSGFTTKNLYAILFFVFRLKSCNSMSFTWNTLQNILVLMSSHLSYSSFCFQCCIGLPILIWIPLNLILLWLFCLSYPGSKQI
jgi:hypothetical protein